MRVIASLTTIADTADWPSSLRPRPGAGELFDFVKSRGGELLLLVSPVHFPGEQPPPGTVQREAVASRLQGDCHLNISPDSLLLCPHPWSDHCCCRYVSVRLHHAAVERGWKQSKVYLLPSKREDTLPDRELWPLYGKTVWVGRCPKGTTAALTTRYIKAADAFVAAKLIELFEEGLRIIHAYVNHSSDYENSWPTHAQAVGGDAFPYAVPCWVPGHTLTGDSPRLGPIHDMCLCHTDYRSLDVQHLKQHVESLKQHAKS